MIIIIDKTGGDTVKTTKFNITRNTDVTILILMITLIKHILKNKLI